MGRLVTLLAREQHELVMGAGVSLGRFEECVLPELRAGLGEASPVVGWGRWGRSPEV